MNTAEKHPAAVFNNLGDEPIHRAIRRLRWFKASFISQINSVSEQTGIQFETNTEILARCFLAWLKEFEANKPDDPAEYEAFVGHASGMMLRRLIELKPVRHLSIPEAEGSATDDSSDPARFWPEGYVYVMYCLNIRKLVVDEAFSTNMEISDSISDISTWWSFRENVTEMSSYAIAFLDMFAGKQPDFDTPYVFQPGADANLLATAPDLPANSGVSRLSTVTGRVAVQGLDGLAYGLQICRHTSRVVLLNNDGTILFEKAAPLDYLGAGQLMTTHAGLIDALLDAAAEHGAADAATTVQGMFVSVPNTVLPEAGKIRSELEQKTGCAVTVAGTATTAAIAEISLGVGATEPTFLMIWLGESLETRLVLKGKISNAATVVGPSSVGKSSADNARIESGADRQRLEAGDSKQDQENELLMTVEVLHKMLGLRQLVCAASDVTEVYQPLLQKIQLAVPDVDIRFSDVSKSPEAFGAVCLQFAGIVISGEPDS